VDGATYSLQDVEKGLYVGMCFECNGIQEFISILHDRYTCLLRLGISNLDNGTLRDAELTALKLRYIKVTITQNLRVHRVYCDV
jgi:hypothetical protein